MQPRYARYVLGVMVGINFLNYLDRYILPVVASKIQDEFHLSDTAIGGLGTAFLLVYAVSALPFGLWADRGVRRTVVGVGVTIWSLATLLTGLARNYAQLFAARAVLGIGEASYYPAGTSLLGDYFPRSQRGRAMSVWGAGTAVGIAVGFAGGGVVAGRFGWRAAFYLTAIPGCSSPCLPSGCGSRSAARPRSEGLPPVPRPELESAASASSWRSRACGQLSPRRRSYSSCSVGLLSGFPSTSTAASGWEPRAPARSPEASSSSAD